MISSFGFRTSKYAVLLLKKPSFIQGLFFFIGLNQYVKINIEPGMDGDYFEIKLGITNKVISKLIGK